MKSNTKFKQNNHNDSLPILKKTKTQRRESDSRNYLNLNPMLTKSMT